MPSHTPTAAMSWALMHLMLFACALTQGCRCGAQGATPSSPPRQVIDCHTHIGLGAGAKADAVFAAAGVVATWRLAGLPYGRALRAVLDESRTMHTKTLVFAGVPWALVDRPDFGAVAADNLRRAALAGARGLKVTKALGLGVRTEDGALLAVDDPRLDPIWDTAGELGLPVVIHTGDPVAFFQAPTPDNERYDELSAHPGWSYYGDDFPTLEALLAARDRMVLRHQKTVFVSVHVGGLAEDLTAVARSLRALPNLWIDVAARLPEIGRHPPEQVRAFFIEFQDRILFGTDLQVGFDHLVLGSSGGPDEPPPSEADAVAYYGVHWRYFETPDRAMPHLTPIQGRWTIDAIALPAPVLQKIYHDNAERLLPP